MQREVRRLVALARRAKLNLVLRHVLDEVGDVGPLRTPGGVDESGDTPTFESPYGGRHLIEKATGRNRLLERPIAHDGRSGRLKLRETGVERGQLRGLGGLARHDRDGGRGEIPF